MHLHNMATDKVWCGAKDVDYSYYPGDGAMPVLLAYLRGKVDCAACLTAYPDPEVKRLILEQCKRPAFLGTPSVLYGLIEQVGRERDESRALVGRLVHAMEAWGAEGDGVPEPAPGSDIGAAYNAARAYLALSGA
jgi:hypothetical protein